MPREFLPRPASLRGSGRYSRVGPDHPLVLDLLETARNGLSFALPRHVDESVRKYLKAQGYAVHHARREGKYLVWATRMETEVSDEC